MSPSRLFVYNVLFLLFIFCDTTYLSRQGHLPLFTLASVREIILGTATTRTIWAICAGQKRI